MKQLHRWTNLCRVLKRLHWGVWVVLAFLLAIPSFGLCGDKPIVLKGITAFPKSNREFMVVRELVKRVNEGSQGRLKINWIGGPEVVKGFDQPEALRSGMIDMLLFIPTGWYRPILPVAECKGLSQLTAAEERANGTYDLWKDVFRKNCNAEHLGFWTTTLNFQLFTIFPVKGIEDLKGKTIRVMPLYAPFLKALGASPIMMPPPELYTALQRKVVDGYMWLEQGPVSFGWHEVTKYMIEPTVFRGEATVAVNLDKFSKLPADLQVFLQKTMADMEAVGDKMLEDLAREDKATMLKAGVEVNTLPPEDAEKFITTSQEVTWKLVEERAPVYAPKFRQLTTK